MSKDRKKLIVLMALAIFWIGLIVVQRSRVPAAPQATPAKRAQRATASTRQAKKRSKVPELQLSQVERVRPPFEPEVRNIFGSITPVPSPTAPKTRAATQAALPPPPPPDPFVVEAKTIRFLGFAEADGRATAFVTYGSEAFVVTEHEVFGNKFRVKQIEEDALILNSLDGTKEVRLGLGPGPGAALPDSEKQRGKRP